MNNGGWVASCDDCNYYRVGWPIEIHKAADRHSKSRIHTVIMLNNGNLVTRYVPSGIMGTPEQPPY